MINLVGLMGCCFALGTWACLPRQDKRTFGGWLILGMSLLFGIANFIYVVSALTRSVQ